MKYLKLFLISVAIIGLLAGIPRIYSHYNKSNEESVNTEKPNIEMQLPGIWVAEYDNEEYKGQIYYDFRIEYGLMHAYAIEYVDHNGYSTEDNSLSLSIEELNEKGALATYYFPYQDYYLELNCHLKLLSENKLELSYYNNDYSFTEVWTKVKMN